VKYVPNEEELAALNNEEIGEKDNALEMAHAIIQGQMNQ
jgi:hypothetical protein